MKDSISLWDWFWKSWTSWKWVLQSLIRLLLRLRIRQELHWVAVALLLLKATIALNLFLWGFPLSAALIFSSLTLEVTSECEFPITITGIKLSRITTQAHPKTLLTISSPLLFHNWFFSYQLCFFDQKIIDHFLFFAGNISALCFISVSCKPSTWTPLVTSLPQVSSGLKMWTPLVTSLPQVSSGIQPSSASSF